MDWMLIVLAVIAFVAIMGWLRAQEKLGNQVKAGDEMKELIERLLKKSIQEMFDYAELMQNRNEKYLAHREELESHIKDQKRIIETYAKTEGILGEQVKALQSTCQQLVDTSDNEYMEAKRMFREGVKRTIYRTFRKGKLELNTVLHEDCTWQPVMDIPDGSFHLFNVEKGEEGDYNYWLYEELL